MLFCVNEILSLDYCFHILSLIVVILFFFFNATATTEIYTYLHTLSLHDALPICRRRAEMEFQFALAPTRVDAGGRERSEEHTSELQSLMRISYAVFCLKKKNPADTDA